MARRNLTPKYYPSKVKHRDYSLAVTAALTPFKQLRQVPLQGGRMWSPWHNLTAARFRALRSIARSMSMRIIEPTSKSLSMAVVHGRGNETTLQVFDDTQHLAAWLLEKYHEKYPPE